jgi:hypothetical protein
MPRMNRGMVENIFTRKLTVSLLIIFHGQLEYSNDLCFPTKYGWMIWLIPTYLSIRGRGISIYSKKSSPTSKRD